MHLKKVVEEAAKKAAVEAAEEVRKKAAQKMRKESAEEAAKAAEERKKARCISLGTLFRIWSCILHNLVQFSVQITLWVSGWHSGQGSIWSGMTEKIRRRQNISGHLNRVLAQNFEAVLAVVVILVVDLIFAKFC